MSTKPDCKLQDLRTTRELAEEIISRTSQSMKLENQQNSSQRLKKAVEMKAIEIMNRMPKYLWD